MYKTEKFYIVTEANVMANDTIGTQIYTYTGENAKTDAYNKLYRLWSYGVKPDKGETRQYFSATLTEYSHEKAIMLECKVFDYRQSEPAPEPEEPEGGEA